mmetsp:Transcript_22407/g.40387  ORF Transcript_22407/g.40387 Transcript_22407/m.40387 type:complete len:390 (-) Transcript_22407:137-1306(-)
MAGLSEERVLLLHAFGFIGVCTSTGLALPLWRAVNQACEEGNLGGLDSTSWPIYFILSLLWACYSFLIGDPWLFLSAALPGAMFLRFSLKAIRLLGREDGEFYWDRQQAWEDASYPQGRYTKISGHFSDEGVHHRYRLKILVSLERSLVVGFLFAMVMTCLCCTWQLPGLEGIDKALPDKLKKQAMATTCCAWSVLCFGSPMTRLFTLIKRKDASSIFFPVVMTTSVHNLVWLAYGVLNSNVAIWLPHVVGVSSACGQLLVILRYGKKHLHVEDGIAGLGSVLPQQASASTLPGSEDVETISVASSRSPSSPQFGETLQSPPMQAQSAESCGPTSKHADLPDLTGRLKQQGTYEDYLAWQTAYQNWRRGSARGASGELSAIRSREVDLP